MTEGNGIPGNMGPLEVEIFIKGYLRGYRFAVTQLASSYQQLQDQIGQTADEWPDVAAAVAADVAADDAADDDSSAVEEVDDVAAPLVPIASDEDELGFFNRNRDDTQPLSEEEKARINAKLREMVE